MLTLVSDESSIQNESSLGERLRDLPIFHPSTASIELIGSNHLSEQAVFRPRDSASILMWLDFQSHPMNLFRENALEILVEFRDGPSCALLAGQRFMYGGEVGGGHLVVSSAGDSGRPDGRAVQQDAPQNPEEQVGSKHLLIFVDVRDGWSITTRHGVCALNLCAGKKPDKLDGCLLVLRCSANHELETAQCIGMPPARTIARWQKGDPRGGPSRWSPSSYFPGMRRA